jgi:hypothetical protein
MIFGQTVDRAGDRRVQEDSAGRRIGRRVLGAAEEARARAAGERAARQERMRPALAEAIGLGRDAEAALSSARMFYARACAGLVLGEVEEAEVEAIEREIAEAERDVRRYSTAAREIESRLGIIRDPVGHIL